MHQTRWPTFHSGPKPVWPIMAVLRYRKPTPCFGTASYPAMTVIFAWPHSAETQHALFGLN